MADYKSNTKCAVESRISGRMYHYFEITQAFWAFCKVISVRADAPFNDNALLAHRAIFLNIALSASYIFYIIIAVKVIGRYFLLF